MQLVLSLFPGVDLLGRAFESEGYCVVRGPDLLWDQRIEDFHVPGNRFDGVIGGPPCQNYSDANRFRDRDEGDRLIREFLRVVREAEPIWFLLENVRSVPTVQLDYYHIQRLDLLDSECGGRQRRLRHVQFGHYHVPRLDDCPMCGIYGEVTCFACGHQRRPDVPIIRPVRTDGRRRVTPVVTCRPDSEHDRHSRRLERMSAPPLPLRALTPTARSRAIGNAVPWLMGVTLARAVTERGPITEADCVCLCGRPIAPPARHATPACRKRMERRRRGHARVIGVEIGDRGVTAAAVSVPSAGHAPATAPIHGINSITAAG